MRNWTTLAVLVALVAAAEAPAATNTQVPGLQVALRAHGLYRGPIDGIVGPQTAQAVRTFQRRAGLRADGIAGRRTRLALGRLGQPLFGRRTLRRGRVGWDVSVLQYLLARRSLLPGSAIDGRFGPRTTRAVRRFQRRRGLRVDGIAGAKTLSVLAGGRGVAQPLRPPFVRYAVRPGDTLTAIADRYDTTIARLARVNRLDPDRVLLIGRRLRIPQAAPSAPPRRGAVAAAINRWALHYRVEARLLRAIAWQESGYQADIVSRAGARGVMQITPATWDFVEEVLIGRRVPRTVNGNVRIGTAFIRHLLRQFRGDERLALAAYFQGPRSVRKRGLLRETERYVANVLALRARG